MKNLGLLTPDQTATATRYRKSSDSGAAGHCIEAGVMNDGTVVLRHSKHRDQGGLGFSSPEFASFVAGVKAGEFDDLI